MLGVGNAGACRRLMAASGLGSWSRPSILFVLVGAEQVIERVVPRVFRVVAMSFWIRSLIVVH
ncbi:hypothetical protein BH23CHL2_BH23CHL2_05340 [soil metagenome]